MPRHHVKWRMVLERGKVFPVNSVSSIHYHCSRILTMAAENRQPWYLLTTVNSALLSSNQATGVKKSLTLGRFEEKLQHYVDAGDNRYGE